MEMGDSAKDDRAWIDLSFPDQRFIDGVLSFVKFVQVRFPDTETTQCPCNMCKNQRIPVPYEEVKIDLFKHGFNPAYKIWYLHGESETFEHADNESRFHDHQEDVYMDDFDELLINSMAQDSGGNPDACVQDKPNTGTQGENRFREVPPTELGNMPEYLNPLYNGSKYNVLRFTRSLLNLKVGHGWSNRSFTELLQLLKDVLPPDNNTPKNTHYASKVIKEVKLGYEKIHACPNNCMLYWGKQNSKKIKCDTCGVSRFKFDGRTKQRVPAKILRYFPITPRLQRMYSVPWVAKEMTWHSTGRMTPGKMRHPVDSNTWKSMDRRYKDFSSDPRNVRLGLSTDGFNPFGTFSTTHSCWPVLCVPYNLPPGLCMKPQFTMLTLLIEGPSQPGKDIDVFLQPLVAELKVLWEKGVTTLDAFTNTEFNLRAMLLWTIHDFPAYGDVSGCRTKGKFGCPCCGPKTDSMWLRYGMKHAFMGSRRWLSATDTSRKDTSANTFNKKEESRGQPIRLSGEAVKKMTAGLDVVWGKTKKKKKRKVGEDDEFADGDASACFCKQSIFFKFLEYWEHIPVRHNLDVMHIEKNVCENLIALMLNTKGKTKDDANARRDLKRLKIKKRLWLQKQNGKEIQRPGRYWLMKEEKRLFLQTLRDLRVPFGFSSNWRNIVTEDGMDLKGAHMKSHDYHILMQHLLPMLIQHAFKDRKEIRPLIKSFSSFFNALCSKIIDVDSLLILEKDMARTLCELEKYFPPSVFVVMMHLPIHLAYEARVCGPVYYRWMYPFERFMKTFKGYVANKARPEGCVAERYLDEEAIIYCNQYKGKGKTSILKELEEKMDDSAKSLDDIDDNGEAGPVGVGQTFVIHGIEYEQARHWVLNCHPKYETWQRKYTEFLQERKPTLGKKSGHYKVPSEEEFLPWLQQQTEIVDSTDVDFLDIIKGPLSIATRYKKYCINGFLYVTKDHEKTKRYQNSGVSTDCITACRSSAKDKTPVDESLMYYGVLKDIIQLEYREGYKPVLFKCDWVKVTHHGVRCDKEANLRLVNLSNFASSNQLGDEPFIFAQDANQVFYSKDPKEPEWHVVLEVPAKAYYEDKTCILPNESVVTSAEVGTSNSEQAMDDELIYSDPDENVVVVEKTNIRKRSRKR